MNQPNQTEASQPSDENIFTLDQFPDVPLHHGDLLREGERRIRDILHEKTDHKSTYEAAKMVWKGLGKARYETWERVWMACKLMYGMWRSPVPTDRDIFLPCDPKTDALVTGFMGRLVTPESQVYGMENLQSAREIEREGNPVMYICNHASEMDPVLIKVLMDRFIQEKPTHELAAIAQQMREQLVAVVGHKVMLDSFRRSFSKAVSALLTIAPKYRPKSGEEHKEIISAFVNNSKALLQALMSDPNYSVLAFPQGGLTRNKRIAYARGAGIALHKKWAVPLHLEIEDAEVFLRPDAKERMRTDPAKVDLYIGEPFQQSGNVKKLLGNVIPRIQAVGAPTHAYSWGAMRREKSESTEGFEEVYEEVVAPNAT